MKKLKREKIEFGDFQTPAWFCDRVCALLVEKGFNPVSLLEPTCGQGNFLLSALALFPSLDTVVGVEINAKYIDLLQKKLVSQQMGKDKVEVLQADFFSKNWGQILNKLPDPLLIIGNPPWVTNTQLSTIESGNLPQKRNFKKHSGVDAITGKSNFDISEWMLLKMFEWVENKQAVVAMLCKTSVARKVLLQTWRHSNYSGKAQIILIDSKAIFDASVDACLLIYDSSSKSLAKTCDVFADFSDNSFLSKFGYQNRQIVANLKQFENWKHLQNGSKTSEYQWRSGIKHDCANVMELEKRDEIFFNKLGESYKLEDTYLYPMLKSSDIANNVLHKKSRWMIVPQKMVGEATLTIQVNAPQTWAYLTKHRRFLDRRKSAIYKNRPVFSIFGVGNYSFAPWKVAISGLYKHLNFLVVGPVAGKPTVLDDTCYFLPCKSEEEANFIAQMLNSEVAQHFFQSFIFWDAKRPITVKILSKLSLTKLAEELDCLKQFEMLVQNSSNELYAKQLVLLEKVSSDNQYKV